jgi:hypothetical protein
MKKNLLSILLLFIGVFANAQNGLENIIVERYYVSNSADATGSLGALPAGSVTYRIYADMLPGYKFQAAYGIPNHELKLTTSTSFFNNEDYGSTAPTFSKTNAAKNSVMLDSWLSAGAACSGNFGILKADDDGVANIVNNTIPQILQNNNPLAGIPLTTQDGLIAGTPEALTTVGISSEISVFDNVSNAGNSFSTFNGSWASLNGSTGPTSANRVLIAQITTDGCFSFELNIQIGTPTGGAQNYVAKNPTGAEIMLPSLTFNATGTVVPSLNITSTSPICSGLNTTFTANPTNGGTAPVYVWKKNGSAVGTNSPTYVDATLVSGDQILCEMTSNDPCATTTSATSNTITTTVNSTVAASVSITASATNIATGTNVTFTATPTNGGASPSYQWKVNGSNVGTNSATYSSTTLTNGAVVTCEMTSNAVCATPAVATSNSITMTVVRPFIPGNLVVSKTGDGAAALNNGSTLVTLVELSKTGTRVDSISAPITVNGANRILTQSGTATSEGALVLSANRKYLTLVGYDAAPSATPIVSAPGINRVIALVDSSKSATGFNTSTYYPSGTAYSGNNIRSAVTNDGTAFWTGGTSTSDGGVRYVPFGNTTTGGTQLSTTITNVRNVNIFNGQLYVSAGTGTFQSVSLVGTGLPTTSGQTIVQQAGLPTTTSNSVGYVFFDRDPGVAGVDLLYVADQTTANGIRKYSYNGTTWTSRGNITATNGATGITGFYNCATSSIELYVTIGTAAGNSVYKVTDNAGYNFTFQNSGTVITSAANATLLATAPANTAFRGIAFAPNTYFDAPLAYNVTGGGTFCQGDLGFAVGLDNSQVGVNYQLFNGAFPIGSAVAGTGAALSFGVQSIGGTYTVVATNALTQCTTNMTGSAILNEVTLVTPSVSITTASTSICTSESVTFTATPVNGGTTPSYQWKVNGVNAGTDSPTFTTSSLNNNDVVTVVLTSNANSGCFVFGTNPATSNALTITVNPNITATISISASATSICSGASVTFTATATNGGTSPVYQWKKNGVNVGTNSSTYTDAALTNGNAITCELTSNAACVTNSPVTSNTVTMVVITSVTPTISITQFPLGTVCSGSNVTFTAAITNGGTPSYQWKVNGSNVGTNANSYSTTGLVAGDVISCVLTSSITCVTTSTATSNSITPVVTSTPVVSSFTPSNGPAGTVVTINGSNFTALTSVRFNGVVAAFTIVNSTQLTATVPATATTGNITVANACGTGTSATAFTVNVVQGLQNVVVEKYYVSNSADAAGSIGALPAGSVTYRIVEQ